MFKNGHKKLQKPQEYQKKAFLVLMITLPKADIAP